MTRTREQLQWRTGAYGTSEQHALDAVDEVDKHDEAHVHQQVHAQEQLGDVDYAYRKRNLGVLYQLDKAEQQPNGVDQLYDEDEVYSKRIRCTSWRSKRMHWTRMRAQEDGPSEKVVVVAIVVCSGK